MDVKRDILWRVYLCFIAMAAFGSLIIGKVFYIQQIEGDQWRALAEKQQQKVEKIEAERGSIFSEDGSILSTSLPFYDIYIDFGAEGLRKKDGKLFRQHLDSLSETLAKTFSDKPASGYKQLLQQGYARKDRYFLLRKNISFHQRKALYAHPLLKLGKNKSGFIAEVNSKRQNPFGLLANRTIGLYRQYVDGNGAIRNTNVGLEFTYDSLLRGEQGSRIVKYLSGGVYVPVEGSEVEPQPGKDIITTIDVNIQDIAENALHRMMVGNDCVNGTCIVMEVKTGKIKAIANLGLRDDGTYFEDLNYAMLSTEPGSTFKLATLMALLEDEKIKLGSQVDLEGGRWPINKRVVRDSKAHTLRNVSVKEAFERSSNVAMAKLVMGAYGSEPIQFIDHLKRFRLHQRSGIDLAGEPKPIINSPRSKTWSATSLPWMSFGYEVSVTPIQSLMLYNAIANDGAMMKPYLVNAVAANGLVEKAFSPEVLVKRIARPETIQLVKQCLEGVCHDSTGTATSIFEGAPYRVAGKTGTALVANAKRGYAEKIYQSSFAGYFPADNPAYSCIVVIRNKQGSKNFYGSLVAAPVFKEVADKLFALQNTTAGNENTSSVHADSSNGYYTASSADLKKVLHSLNWSYVDSSATKAWAGLTSLQGNKVMRARQFTGRTMPDVRGMGLKDALYLLESLKLHVIANGSGRVKDQSISPGMELNNVREVALSLNR